MSLKHPCRRELTQFMPYHILGNKDFMKHFAIVNEKSKTDKLRDYRTSSRPGFNRLTRAGFRLSGDLDKQLIINVWSFFKRSSHILYLEYISLDSRRNHRDNCLFLLLFRLRIILLLLVFRGFRVLPPFASTPVGEQGCRPPFALPSPPPIG
jgi:hypothetical protein